MMHTNYLDISKHGEVWKTPDLNMDTELKAKLKGSIRRNERVVVGSIVYVSYGDTIDFSYSPPEMRWINENALIKSEKRGDIEFTTTTDETNEESVVENETFEFIEEDESDIDPDDI